MYSLIEIGRSSVTLLTEPSAANIYVHIHVDTHNRPSISFPKSTKSRKSDFSVSVGTNSNGDFGLVWIGTIVVWNRCICVWKSQVNLFNLCVFIYTCIHLGIRMYLNTHKITDLRHAFLPPNLPFYWSQPSSSSQILMREGKSLTTRLSSTEKGSRVSLSSMFIIFLIFRHAAAASEAKKLWRTCIQVGERRLSIEDSLIHSPLGSHLPHLEEFELCCLEGLAILVSKALVFLSRIGSVGWVWWFSIRDACIGVVGM